MNTIQRTAVALGLTAAIAGPTAFVLAGPATADQEKGGWCAGARYELSVDREGRGYEIDADLDGAEPGSAWRLVLRHDGEVVAKGVRTADREGDIDLERLRPDTAGTDTFTLTVRKVSGPPACRTTIVAR
ncbi:MAG TPA: hypothetical protein PLP61_08280 [Nocardioides sp.]|uniref:hypothetical protein n=1 Tax=Nocardioides sp. TaxID=35761 RepID=UPI002D037D18|nr:hypothetical protein [Nocardioides sp.]HQR27019.1 hypothetical protein [Nocardioides sp.]